MDGIFSLGPHVMQKELQFLLLLMRTLIPSWLGGGGGGCPTFMTSCSPNDLPKAPPADTIPMGESRLPHVDFGETHTFSL